MENKNFKVDGNDFSKEEVIIVKTEQNFNAIGTALYIQNPFVA